MIGSVEQTSKFIYTNFKYKVYSLNKFMHFFGGIKYSSSSSGSGADEYTTATGLGPRLDIFLGDLRGLNLETSYQSAEFDNFFKKGGIWSFRLNSTVKISANYVVLLGATYEPTIEEDTEIQIYRFNAGFRF